LQFDSERKSNGKPCAADFFVMTLHSRTDSTAFEFGIFAVIFPDQPGLSQSPTLPPGSAELATAV